VHRVPQEFSIPEPFTGGLLLSVLVYEATGVEVESNPAM